MARLTHQERPAAVARSWPSADPPAELTLRFGAQRLQGRVHWPQPSAHEERPPLIVLLADAHDASTADVLSGMLCSAATVVVLAITTSCATRHVELAALGWAAEHAIQLAANPGRLSVAGVNTGAGRAAWLAISARENAWPQLCRQLLVDPTFAPECAMPSDVTGVAPATIVTTGSPDADGARYAAVLRAAGAEADELRRPDHGLPRGRQLGDLVPSLRTGATAAARITEPTQTSDTADELAGSPAV